jgi:hypothetical protein
MQLQLNVNDLKAGILLNFLDLFKQDDLIKDYQIISTKSQYNDYEEELLEDLKDLKSSISESGIKTGKYIEFTSIK